MSGGDGTLCLGLGLVAGVAALTGLLGVLVGWLCTDAHDHDDTPGPPAPPTTPQPQQGGV